MQQLLDTTKRSALVVECAREVLDALPPVMWYVRRQMRSHRGGLSLAQFRSLVRVNRQPQATLSDVAEHLGAALPTASRIVSGLVDKGLVLRHGCRWDRRQVLFELTAKGRDVLQTARKATQQHMETELDKLSLLDRKSLIQATKILKGVFGPASDLWLASSRNAARRRKSAAKAGSLS
jgi:DNA-binding MarR family transcriptional regulator